MLSALGRREEALRATEEAVAVRRRLAQENPQAFLPDLAMSLGAHGTVLRGLGRHKEAAKAFEEGLQSVLPALRLWPQALQRLADTLLQGYLRSCRDARRKPDASLVAEAQKVLSEAAG
jgi:tetratricopeptide (TPR) repeat protein